MVTDLDRVGIAEAGELGRGLPGWLLRVPAALACLVMVAVLAAERTEPAVLVAFGVVSLLAVALPASPAPALVIVLAAVLIAVDDPDPLRPAVLAMVPAVHLLHVACALAGMLPLRSRLHLAALRRPAVRYLMVQTGVFLVAGLAALVPRGTTPAVLEALAMLSVAALALVVARLLHRPQ